MLPPNLERSAPKLAFRFLRLVKGESESWLPPFPHHCAAHVADSFKSVLLNPDWLFEPTCDWLSSNLFYAQW